MRRFDVEQLDGGLTPAARMALVGRDLMALQPAWQPLDAALPVRFRVNNGDVLRSRLVLLVQRKSGFDAVEDHRGNAFFGQTLGLTLLISSLTLRQRLDAWASALFECVPDMIEALLASQRPNYGVLLCG